MLAIRSLSTAWLGAIWYPHLSKIANGYHSCRLSVMPCGEIWRDLLASFSLVDWVYIFPLPSFRTCSLITWHGELPRRLATLDCLQFYPLMSCFFLQEVERSNFWLEVPKIIKRFWLAIIFSFLSLAMFAVFSTSLLPYGWAIPPINWAVVFPVVYVNLSSKQP